MEYILIRKDYPDIKALITTPEKTNPTLKSDSVEYNKILATRFWIAKESLDEKVADNGY